MNGKIINFFFMYLGSCFSENVNPQDDVKYGMAEGLDNIFVSKKTSNFTSVLSRNKVRNLFFVIFYRYADL